MESHLERIDFEQIKKRFDAFWNKEIIDRPMVAITAPRRERKQIDFSIPDTIEARWTDIEYILKRTDLNLSNTAYYGDAIPSFWPNIGPDSFTAYLGGEIVFKDNHTSWVKSFVEDISDYDPVFDKNNKWWIFMNDLIDAACETAKGRYLVGIPDMHGGGDSLVAAFDAGRLAMDLYDKPDDIKRVMKKLTDIYIEIFNIYYDRISRDQEGSITWIPAYSRGKYVALQNDFSGLISPEMFKEFFLYEDVIALSQHLDNSIYHLDGPIAIGNLDYLLEVETLDGIQWVPGAGAKPMREWMDLCSRILNGGKCLQIGCPCGDVEYILSSLRHEGLLISTSCGSEEEAKVLLDNIYKKYGR
ncbi:hypothetical protein GF312_03755 [Candidatus Poribacteria bacterium]|nr:hypothetical protein [Candidatus Poribacteria bacterium]